MPERQSTAAALATVAAKLDGLVDRMDRDAAQRQTDREALRADHTALSDVVSQVARTQAILVEQDKNRDIRIDRIEATVGNHGEKLNVLDSLRAKAIGAGMVLGAIGALVMAVWSAAREKILTAIGWS